MQTILNNTLNTILSDPLRPTQILAFIVLLLAEVFSHLSTRFYFKKRMALYQKLNTITTVLYILFLALTIITIILIIIKTINLFVI